ncbi:hypothetical protein PL336_07145 [Sulfitobacter faviae]|uniref:Concanavalin A-like lectin/glucanases superfamily protein n=1 Tax=Sulfitobacter faviae TaxID=1775881 RepID=A0AAX3LSQ9_9RHOB|nr:LamG-like jellyroll fold domain-containing protein [Sulfitobacter faviae]WCE71599.1 hypothetical protein PL336_07145 [Sulfitobacter faviae]
MTVEQQVDALTASVEDLKGAVVSKKATLDASVADAQLATAQAQIAKVNARSARDEAEAFKDAAYTAAQSAASAVAYQDLSAVALTKAVTAVDAFIYDTSKDSDGGAWRHRCAGTSWYREPLNTATRGARREFPAVAVIVAESNKVTIYDGDDPTLPMWIVFNGAVSHSIFLGYSSPGGFSVTMRDGHFCVGTTGISTNGSINGLAVANFVADTLSKYDEIGFAKSNQGIADRNDNAWSNGLGWWSIAKDPTKKIVNQYVNDVSLTVLPNAPLDPSTGLPLPTIAVATAGGVSVIKDDGFVANHNLLLSYQGVSFDDDNRLYYGTENSQFRFAEPSVWKTPSFTQSGSYRYKNLSVGAFPVINTSTSGTLIPPVGRGIDLAVAVKSGGVGVTHLRHTPSNASSSLVAYTAATYATGWLPGDIKGAFLADADETDLVSEDLAVNGSFGSDASGWSLGTDWAHDPVNQRLGRIGSTYHNAFPTATIAKLVVDQSYTMEVECGSGAGTIGYYTASGVYGALATGINRISFTYKGGNYPFFYSSSNERWIDSFKVFRSSHDRSVNADGKRPSDLIVNGTISREPALIGADLVAYGGFASNNYLWQPYNPDYDFGTGPFCIMAWARFFTGSNCVIASRTDYNPVGWGSDGWWTFGIRTTPNPYALRFRSYGVEVVGNRAIADNGWHFCAMTYDGSAARLYVDGDLDFSGARTINHVGTNTPDLLVGVGSYLGNITDPSYKLALLRIAATAPSSEQIRRIYEDEKALFQENAACTLYGASDAVTALAHDSDSGLLHVGTSAGRSVFKGLRRVANTTTPVATAIAAAGDLVVEQ